MPELTIAAVEDACRYADRWLQFQQQHLGLPGVQAAVLFEDSLVLSTAHGLADLERAEPLRTDHRFRVASHSKTFTAAAVMRFVEQGRLRLDDTIGQWIDELQETTVGDRTIRELLAHAGGVIRDGSEATFWALQRAFPDRADLIADAAVNGAILEPNERFKYSNVGYSLLGLVLEQVSGQTFVELMQNELIGPLELGATTAEFDTEDDLVTGYTAPIGGGDDRRLPIDHIVTNDMAAATGFISNASDLVHWFSAHFLGDQRVLTDRSKRVMQQPLLDVDASGKMRYGLGLAADQVGNRTMLGHGGGFPGQLSRTFFDPADRLAISTMTNGADGSPAGLAGAIVRLIDTAAAASPDPAADGLDLQRYEGRFAGLWGVMDLVALGGRLHILDPRGPDPVMMPTTLDLVDESTMRIADTIGYGSPGETIEIHWASDGSVARLGRSGEDAIPLDAYRQKLSTMQRWSLASGD